MLERLLKPSANSITRDQSGIRRSVKRPREEPAASEKSSMPEKKFNSDTTGSGFDRRVRVKAEPPTPNTTMTNNDLDVLNDDMDFSMLDDEENQFNEHVADTSAKLVNDNAVKAEAKAEQDKEDRAKAEQIKAELQKKENENYAKLLSNWGSDFKNENDDDDQLLGAFDVEATQASVVNSVDGKSSMKLWYWDAYEDPIKMPGKIFLFGKMVSEQNPNEFKSVCVTIENVNRCLYLLPRHYVCILFHIPN